MKLAVMAFTARGMALAERICAAFDQCAGFYCSSVNTSTALTPAADLSQWTEDAFGQYEGLIFVGAVGIAVRAIAPYVRDKLTDPAVIALDEDGCFVVPLLGGHVGGANHLAQAIGAFTGGQAVISTATDRRELWAIDSWAKANNCLLDDRLGAKKISAALLKGQTIGLWTPFEVASLSAKQVVWAEAGDLGVVIDFGDHLSPFAQTVHLRPKIITLGLGCRRGVKPAVLAEVVERHLQKYGLRSDIIGQIATIDLKREETAILQLGQGYGVPVRFFSAAALLDAQYAFTPFLETPRQRDFCASDFVRNTAGVDNVCERAAVLAANGPLLTAKTAENGVTVALAMSPWQIRID